MRHTGTQRSVKGPLRESDSLKESFTDLGLAHQAVAAVPEHRSAPHPANHWE